MGNRGVDLAARKAQMAAAQQVEDIRALVEWARAMQMWLNDPVDDDEVVERTIKVALTGQTLVLSKRLAPEGP